MFSKSLEGYGINLQAVFYIQDLPQEVYESLSESAGDLSNYTQLILLAHGGKRFWSQLGSFKAKTKDPVDEYSRFYVQRFFQEESPAIHYRIVYPGPDPVQLQRLGELAGWHFKSPFMVGINDVWGSWYAYRAVILADSQFEVSTTSKPQEGGLRSPCISCESKPCMSACPPKAVSEDGLEMSLCIKYRKSENSQCQHTCLARIACPVAREHQYSDEQIQYHYKCSLDTITKYY